MEGTDANLEIKTEFYTREGVWKLVNASEFVRQSSQQSSSSQSYYGANQTTSSTLNGSNIGNNNNGDMRYMQC